MNNLQRSISIDKQLRKVKLKMAKQEDKLRKLYDTNPRKLAAPLYNTPYGYRRINIIHPMARLSSDSSYVLKDMVEKC